MFLSRHRQCCSHKDLKTSRAQGSRASNLESCWGMSQGQSLTNSMQLGDRTSEITIDPCSIGYTLLEHKLRLGKVCGDLLSELRNTSRNSLGFPASMSARQRGGGGRISSNPNTSKMGVGGAEVQGHLQLCSESRPWAIWDPTSKIQNQTKSRRLTPGL